MKVLGTWLTRIFNMVYKIIECWKITHTMVKIYMHSTPQRPSDIHRNDFRTISLMSQQSKIFLKILHHTELSKNLN